MSGGWFVFRYGPRSIHAAAGLIFVARSDKRRGDDAIRDCADQDGEYVAIPARHIEPRAVVHIDLKAAISARASGGSFK